MATLLVLHKNTGEKNSHSSPEKLTRNRAGKGSKKKKKESYISLCSLSVLEKGNEWLLEPPVSLAPERTDTVPSLEATVLGLRRVMRPKTFSSLLGLNAYEEGAPAGHTSKERQRVSELTVVLPSEAQGNRMFGIFFLRFSSTLMF